MTKALYVKPDTTRYSIAFSRNERSKKSKMKSEYSEQKGSRKFKLAFDARPAQSLGGGVGTYTFNIITN